MTIELGLFGLFILFGSLILIGFVIGKKLWNRMNDKEKIINDLRLDRENLLLLISKLQSNWNSLREWLEARKNLYNSSIADEYKIVLDKMNELEGADND